jgi:hypothetical protein
VILKVDGGLNYNPQAEKGGIQGLMASLDNQSINLDGTLISEYEVESLNLSYID